MGTSSRTNRLLLILTLLCLVLARVDGAHLHLCFDGGEPASTVHVLDDSYADFHPGADQEHTDQDVSLIGSMLVKQQKSTMDIAPVLIVSLVLLGLLMALGLRQPIVRRLAPQSSLFVGFLPPPRGPPA